MANQRVTKTVSTFGSVNWRDGAKGLLMACLTGSIVAVSQTASTGQVPTDYAGIGAAAIAGGAAYLLKQFGSGPVKEEKI